MARDDRRRLYAAASEVRKLPLRHRLDAFLLVLISAGLLSVFFATWFIVEGLNRAGAFDGAPLRGVRDDRILTNVREGGELLAAAYHAPSGEVFISQEGRRIHRFDPPSGIWREDRIRNETLNGELSQLRSDCGTHVAGANDEVCRGRDTMWARSTDGGLVRRESTEDWRTVIGDTRFVGVNGRLVQADELTAAALSDDGRWLMLGTAENGVGLFDRSNASWVPLSGELGRTLPRAIRFIEWWQGEFWLGTGAGLAAVEPGYQARARLIDDTAGDTIALAVKQGAALYAATQSACTDEAGLPCLNLQRFDDTQSLPASLLRERRFADLRDGTLHNAVVQNDRLVVAGEAGIYAYDPGLRHWSRLEKLAVTAEQEVADGVYYGGVGKIVLIRSAAVERSWQLPGSAVVDIEIGEDVAPLALLADGDVFRLSDDEAESVYAYSRAPQSWHDLSKGVRLQDWVFLADDRGNNMLHNLKTRANRQVGSLGATSRLPTTGYLATTQLYLFDNRRDDVAADVYELDSLLAGNTDPVATTATVQGPVESLQAWAEDGIAMIDRTGSAVLLGPDLEVRLTGDSREDLSGDVTLNDVAQAASGLYVASEQGVMRYGLGQRGWDGPHGPETRQPVQRLALIDGAPFGITADGQLADIDGNRLVIGASSIGIGDQALSDVMPDASQLYLAGQGRVVQYDMAERRVQASFDIGGAAVRLIGVVQGKPVAIAGRRLVWGDAPIAPENGAVTDAWIEGGYLWSRRGGRAGRFVMGTPLAAPAGDEGAVCLFRQASVASGSIVDAVDLGSGRLAVLTTGGLHIYDRRFRRWYDVEGASVAVDERLFDINGHLVWLTPRLSGSTIRYAAKGSLDLPGSCAPGRARLAFTVVGTPSVAVSDDGTDLRWLANGRLYGLTSGGGQALLGSADRPNTASLRRVYADGNSILLTDRAGLWRYRSGDQTWQRISINQGDTVLADLADIDLHRAGTEWAVTVRQESRTLIGTWTGTGAVQVAPLPDTGVSPGASDLRQLTQYRDRWVFVFPRMLAFVDPATRSAERLELPVAGEWRVQLLDDQSFSAYERSTRRVLLLESGGTPWQIADYDELRLDEHDAAVLAAGSSLLILRGNGAVERCRRTTSLSCTTEIAAATALDDVSSAYPVGDDLLTIGADGWHLLSRVSGERAPVVASAAAPQLVRMHDGDVWTVAADGVRRLQGAHYPDSKRIAVDDRNSMWVQDRAGWRRWAGDRLLSVSESFAIVPPVVASWVSDNGASVAIDAGGLVHGSWRPSRSVLALPRELALEDVRGVIAGDGDVWLRHGTRLVRLVPAPCEDDPQQSCLSQALAIELAGQALGELYRVQTAADGWLLDHGEPDAGATVKVSADGTMTHDRGRVGAPQVGLEDVWPREAAGLRSRPDGRTAWSPITALEVTAEGVVARGDATVELAKRGMSVFDEAAPFANGWLRWLPQSRELEITAGRTVRMPAEEFLRGGQIAAVRAGTALATADGFVNVNASGIWTYADPEMSLLDGPHRFVPLTLAQEARVAHGRILSDTNMYGLDASPLASGELHAVNVGAFTLTENVRSGGIRITRGSGQFDHGNGFPWDRLISVGYRDGRQWVHSVAGIRRGTLSDLLGPPPDGTVLWSVADATTRARSGARWFAWSNRWSAAGPPPVDRELHADAAWTWYRRGERVEVDLNDPVGDFRLEQHGVPIRFTSDVLLTASGSADGFVLLTAAWTEAGNSLTDIISGDSGFGARSLPQEVDALMSLRHARRPAVFASAGSRRLRWNHVDQRFRRLPGDTDPFASRDLEVHDLLRFRYRGGTVFKDMRVRDLNAADTRWQEFRFDGGRFPFDVIRGAGFINGDVFLASNAGLERRPFRYADTRFDLQHVDSVINLGRPASFSAVTQLERPEGTQDRLQIEHAGGCLHFDGSGHAACGADRATRFHRGAAPGLWNWVRTQGRAEGTYVTDRGTAHRRVSMGGGRFEHDQFRDIRRCGDRSASVWRSRPWVTVHEDNTELVLDAQITTYDLSDIGPVKLVCLEREVVAGDDFLAPGLYVRSDRGFHHLGNDGWVAVPGGPLTDALRLRANDAVLVDERRLRIRAAGDTLAYEYADLAGRWRVLGTTDDGTGLDVDRFRHLQYEGDALWAATDAGIVTLDENSSDALTFRPDAFHKLDYPAAVTNCRVSDIRNVRALHAPAAANAAAASAADAPIDADTASADSGTVMRCDGDPQKTFAGDLVTGADHALWQPRSDPFENVTLSRPTAVLPLTVTRLARRDDQPGSLRFALHANTDGAPVEAFLTDGRFGFDALTHLVHRDDALEVVTELGWFTAHSPDVSLALARFREAAAGDDADLDAGDVSAVAWTDYEGVLSLCAETADRAVLLDGRDYRADKCSAFQAFDGLWTYQYGDELAIRGTGLRGNLGSRQFTDGRFGDRVVIGMPVTSAVDGRPTFWIPTIAGVLALRADPTATTAGTKVYGLVLPPFLGFRTGDDVPKALHADANGNLRYATPDGLVGMLDDEIEPWPVPIGDEPLEQPDVVIEDSLEGRLSVEWRVGKRVHWALAEVESQAPVLYDQLLISVAGWPDYEANRARWGNPGPLLSLEMGDVNLRVAAALKKSVLVPSRNIRPIDFIVAGGRVLIVEPNDVLEVDIAQLMHPAFTSDFRTSEPEG